MEYIYKIINKYTGRIYIGATRNFKKRKKDHLLELKSGRHKNILMQRDCNKYGIDGFSFDIILENEDCFSVEQDYINKFGTYNIARGGIGGDVFNNLPTYRQEEIRDKVRTRNNKRYTDPDEKKKCNAFPDWLSDEDREARLKIWSECKKGPNNGRFKHDKRVLQIDKDTGDVLNTWPYARMLKEHGFNPRYVIYCCNKEKSYATHKGYAWRWEDEL